MDRVKKNIKRIWNSKCKYLLMIACALILANSVNFIQTSLNLSNDNVEELEERKSVEFASDTWESKGDSSWHITKSADWTGLRQATVKFDVETTGKLGNKGIDVILVLDTSSSMNSNNKLVKMKENAISLVDFLLSGENNRVAVISFNHVASIQSSFSDNKNLVIGAINGLIGAGETSYTNAYKAVISLLSQEYVQDDDRNLVMLFLTDGIGGNAKAQYSILKENYNIKIRGIQYELGTNLKKAIMDISDEQYIANTINLRDVFLEASGIEEYETFEITDYISKDFHVGNVSDIRVSRGKAQLETLADGTQRVVWKIPTDEEKFITGFRATMEIDITFTGEADAGKTYRTNNKEDVETNLPSGEREKITSELSPEIRGGYYVDYHSNLPSGCSSEGKNFPTRNSYFAYETVEIPKGNYICSGWQFKGWKIPDGLKSLGNDRFVMPPNDITIIAEWTKVDLAKSMEGTISQPVEELKTLMIENEETTVDTDSGLTVGQVSSASNGRGLYIRSGTENDTNPIYYYRGNVGNNNVLFAGICWQIVRTTETGGVKLIYNGISVDGESCLNTGNSYIGSSTFNSSNSSPTYSGYMTGSSYTFTSNNSGYTSYYFGNSVTYDSSKAKYQLVTPVKGGPTTGYHYTCNTNIKTGKCSPVRYIYYATNFTVDSSGSTPRYYIELTGGTTIEDVISGLNSNSSSSKIKSVIDNWYKTNIADKGYTKYLEDAVWCNDRKFVSGGLMSKDASYGVPVYGASNRLTVSSSSRKPVVKNADACPNVNDRFTTTSSGNKKLTYPVGMLTADEVMLSGIGYSSSESSRDSYLSTSYAYWTMTPNNFLGTATNFSVGNGGYLVNSSTSSSYNVRPSISLKSGTYVKAGSSSNGTKEHPYVVVVE